ncbi:MAG TPA: HIT domain-containing protein [Terriglobales bacterium]
MDYLWTPWRYAYITESQSAAACIFCEKLNEKDDAKALIVHRGLHCFICLNAYPYNNGHAMVVPYAHLDQLLKLPDESATEMMQLTQQLEAVLRDLYHPDGINLGMNLGKAAGAGVAGHIHMHVLPRWSGDTNFMTVVAETRVLPEALETTYARMKKAFEQL